MIEDKESLPIRLSSKTYDKIELAVVSLYSKLNIKNIPIDPVKIANQLGYIVKKYSSIKHNVYLKSMTEESDGLSYFDPNVGTYIIYYNDAAMNKRIRFTIMHEIGHIQLEHKEESSLAKKMADYFAAYFLAPSPLIGHFKCEEYEDVINTFDISFECAEICFQRYMNWASIPKMKEYELKLLDLFH